VDKGDGERIDWWPKEPKFNLRSHSLLDGIQYKDNATSIIHFELYLDYWLEKLCKD
jgi:hypothetical protein